MVRQAHKLVLRAFRHIGNRQAHEHWQNNSLQVCLGPGKVREKQTFFRVRKDSGKIGVLLFYKVYEKTKNFIFSLTQIFAVKSLWNYSFIRKEPCVRFVVHRLWFSKSLGNKGINFEVKNMDSVQNMPKEMGNAKPGRSWDQGSWWSRFLRFVINITRS